MKYSLIINFSKCYWPKKGSQSKWPNPKFNWDLLILCSYIGQHLTEVKYCSIQSWLRGGLSSLPMVSTKKIFPPTPDILRRTEMLSTVIIAVAKLAAEVILPLLFFLCCCCCCCCCMMTSSNGNIFRVTGPLCGEFTGHRWIPHTKAGDAQLDVFFDLSWNKWSSKQSGCRWFETPSRPLWCHCSGCCCWWWWWWWCICIWQWWWWFCLTAFLFSLLCCFFFFKGNQLDMHHLFLDDLSCLNFIITDPLLKLVKQHLYIKPHPLISHYQKHCKIFPDDLSLLEWCHLVC